MFGNVIALSVFVLYFISSIVIMIPVSPEQAVRCNPEAVRWNQGFFQGTVVPGDATSLIAMIQWMIIRNSMFRVL